MTDFYGYNQNEVELLMEELADTYDKLGEEMSENWSQVSSTMQANWKGVDEQDYEEKLAKRMNTLYENTTHLIRASLETIASLATSWRDYQNNNRLQGGDGVSQVANSTIEFTIPAIQAYDMSSIVKLTENSFQGENLGIQKGGGAIIKNAINNYTTTIQATVSALFSRIDSNKAFLGSQSQKVNDFLYAVGEAVKGLSTDIDDMYNAIDNLTDKGYGEADVEASASIDSAAQAVEEIR